MQNAKGVILEKGKLVLRGVNSNTVCFTDQPARLAGHLPTSSLTMNLILASLLGFEMTIWDYLTFAVLVVCLLLFLVFLVWLAGLPGRIAIARKHPDAEAVMVMGYAGVLGGGSGDSGLYLGFKPTNIVDVRRFPREEAAAIDQQIARLKGEEPPVQPALKPPAPPEVGRLIPLDDVICY